MELQGWILFSICVCGKPAKVTEQKVKDFFRDAGRPMLSPFGIVSLYIQNGELLTMLQKHKLGQYKRIEKAFRQAIKLDLDHLTIEKLDAIPGIGPKSARMVMMYAFEGLEYAVLDTHVLKWLAAKGYKVPKSSPEGKVYDELEKIVFKEAAALNMTARDFDTWVWKMYARQ